MNGPSYAGASSRSTAALGIPSSQCSAQDGGSDGSDGGDYGSAKGGKGSGLDVGTLNMTRFVLAPGKGGIAGSNYHGGGGGGILVNGEKPDGGSEHWGEGFGGGGDNGSIRFPGCVLVEILVEVLGVLVEV